MSKRGSDSVEDVAGKKIKHIKNEKSVGDDKKDDINVIDSELLSHQTNYQDDGSHQSNQGSGTSADDVNASATKAIEDLNKLRNAGELSHQFDYNQLLKSQGVAAQAQAQREAQAQAIQAQAQAQAQAEHHSQQQHHQQQHHQQSQDPNDLGSISNNRPAAGTDEWHRIRRDNHKEVERRRRENINAGIKALSSLLPTAETNKSQILQRAVEYIKRLKENETNNIEKWTLEKLLTDQAVAELSASNDKLKLELEKTYRELEHYKKLAGEAKK